MGRCGAHLGARVHMLSSTFMLRLLLMVAMVVSGAVAVPNCVPIGGCTAIGCGIPFEMMFSGANDRPGLYEVDVVTDGVAATCTIELPRGCDVVPTCTTSDLPWGLKVYGCSGNDAGNGQIEGIVYTFLAPASVEVVVRRDGVVVGATKVKPAYSNSNPNGGDCDPECRSAREAIALTP
jgi:hypothetical protein